MPNIGNGQAWDASRIRPQPTIAIYHSSRKLVGVAIDNLDKEHDPGFEAKSHQLIRQQAPALVVEARTTESTPKAC